MAGAPRIGAVPVASDTVKPKGGLIGGTLGYNMQTGNWVWGLETDIDYSTIDGTNIGTGICGGAVGCETQNHWLGTARGRIGYAFDRWLPYFTGGAAFGDVKMTPNSGVSETETRLGWTLGGGVEWAFMGAWSAKLEYLYVDLGTATCSTATCGIETDVGFKANLVRARHQLPVLIRHRCRALGTDVANTAWGRLYAGPLLFRRQSFAAALSFLR